MKKQKISEFWNLGAAIGLCAAIGIIVGALQQNLLLWLFIGAGLGVVLGAITVIKKTRYK